MKNHFGCPVQATTNVMAGKWKVLIVWHLSFGSRRFAEIRDFLPGASEKVLTAQPRELQRDGVIERIVTPTVPPRVDYKLTWERTRHRGGSNVCLEHETPGNDTEMASANSRTGLAPLVDAH